MRIAILSCFYPYRGGIAQFNANLLNELGKTNVVRAFNFKRQYPDILFPGKTQFVSPDDEAVPVESYALLDTADPFNWRRTLMEIKFWNPSVLIVRYWMPWFAPSLGYICRNMPDSCKVVGILDNVIPHEQHFFDTPLTKYFLSGLDGCVTLCKEVASDLLKLKPDAKYKVLYHPVYSHFGEKMDRAEAEKALGLKPGMKNILFFGLIREYKGLDILLSAFDQLGRDYQLIIAGEPYGSFDQYQRMIDKSPNGTRIKCFTRYIPDEDVKLFFSAADVAVLPYRSATQSGISNISNHFELPMIVTNVGGLKETIADKGLGIVCSDSTPNTIAKEIEGFFKDPSIRNTLAENIRKENNSLSWGNFASTLLDFIQNEI